MFSIACDSTYLTGESHADLSNSYHLIYAGEVEAGARTVAAGIWYYTQPCRGRERFFVMGKNVASGDIVRLSNNSEGVSDLFQVVEVHQFNRIVNDRKI